VELRFARLVPEAVVPARAHGDDAGLDLAACEGATLPPGGRASVGTGLAVEIPAGHAGLVLPRSGLAARHGIALVNAPGLVDPGYRGEVRVLLLNTDRDDAFEVRPGDRIAQLLLVPFVAAEPVAVAALDDTERGAGGFGSSGLQRLTSSARTRGGKEQVMDDEERTPEAEETEGTEGEVESRELGDEELEEAAGGDPGWTHPDAPNPYIP
jgi:dUTP pyrophosphatase